MKEEHVVSATDISHALLGIDFPANRQDLINQSRQNDAIEICYIIECFPENKVYNSMSDVEFDFKDYKDKQGGTRSGHLRHGQGKTKYGGQR